ncbi:hypothetical protein IL306_010191 [Fusarium sp. DS 682]|nr:hypothetical protein IL306_010191 [Fusarium sp. DS 682]
MGGTDLLRALEAVVKRRAQERGPTQIIILTDGELEPEESIQFIWKKRQLLGDGIRFFALGIGDEVSHRLVESIAECGGGFSDVVHTTKTPRWHNRLNRLVKSALEPNSWSCDIDLGSEFERQSLANYGLGQNNISPSGKIPYFQSPFPTPPLHPFNFNSIFFLINLRHEGELPKTVTITTTTPGARKKSYELPVEIATSNDETIHRLAAKSILLDLEAGVKRGSTETVPTKENGEEIGTMYSITSNWTSFVAISENEPTETEEEQKMNHYKALLDQMDIGQFLDSVDIDEGPTPSGLDEDVAGSIYMPTQTQSSGKCRDQIPKFRGYSCRNSDRQRPPKPSPWPRDPIAGDGGGGSWGYHVVATHSNKADVDHVDTSPRPRTQLDSSSDPAEPPPNKGDIPWIVEEAPLLPPIQEPLGARLPSVMIRDLRVNMPGVNLPKPGISESYDTASRTSSPEYGSQSSFRSPSYTNSPLNWQVAMECQDGNGLFNLPEQTRENLHLHFCSDTGTKLSPKISELLSNSSIPIQERDETFGRLLDTLMMIQCYKTHLAQEEDIWDLMMERAKDALLDVLGLSEGVEALEEVENLLRASMMHAHYMAATGVRNAEQGGESVDVIK